MITLDVVVRCRDQHARLLDSVRSIREQTRPASAIVLVTDNSTPIAALPWVDAVADRLALRHVHVEDISAARSVAAGVECGAGDAIVWLESGERLAPGALEGLADILEREPRVDFVTTSWLLLGPGDRSRVQSPAPTDRNLALAAPAGGDGLSVIRRAALAQVGPPDPDAGDLWAWELRLRLVLSGRQVRATHEPMLVRSWRADAPYALQWSDPARDSWIAHVLDRHASAFAEEPAAAIHDHEVVFRALDVDHAALAARHRELSEEITRLKAQGAQLPVQRAADSPSVRRLSPVARDWGYSRGTPIDRHYIELFLAKRASDVRGAVLEIKDDSYARRFGGGAVTHVDTLDVAADNRRATVVGDLRCAATIADETYDCVILTQTAHLIDDMTAVISECARMLRPGGVLLATFPATSRVCVECGGDRDLWRMTPAGARRLCETAFHPADLEVSSFGNMLANTAFLEGLAREDLTSAELDVSDPYFPLLTGVRAVKRRYASHPAAPAITRRHESSRLSHAILLYHRVARPGTDVHRLAVSPERFAEHSAFLQARSEVLSLDAFVQGWQEGTLPPGAVAITFDDGYRDVLESAAPILVRAGLPATCFMTTHRINEPCVFWWDVLEQALLADGPPLPSTFETVLPGEGAVCLPVVSSRQRLEAHWRVYNGVVGLAPEERDGVIRHVRRWAGRPESDGRCRMASHEVRAWASLPGLQIGAHSAWHTILPRQSPAVQRAEAQESKSALESLLGAPVRSFAYPHGAVDEACEAAVRAAGYEYALTSAGPGMSQFVENRWRLPRVEVTPDVSARFEDLMPSR